MRHLGFHRDFIAFYYPSIGGDGHYIDTQKKGIVRRSLVRKYHGWTSSHGGSSDDGWPESVEEQSLLFFSMETLYYKTIY